MLNRKIVPLLILAMVQGAFSLQAYPASATTERPLVLWVMPNEPPVPEEEVPSSTEEIRDYLNRNNILNSPEELERDFYFARGVFGQKKILAVIDQYKNKRKDVEVKIKFITWGDIFHRIEGAATTGVTDESPDIVQIGTTWTPYFADRGVILDITNSININKDLYFPCTIENCKICGSDRIYAAPWFIDARILLYWKKAVDNPEEDLKDWEHFEETCKRIQERIENKDEDLRGMEAAFAIGIARDWDLLHELAIFIWGAGGKIIEVDDLRYSTGKRLFFTRRML